MKREGGSFDITMGTSDGAKVCELICICISYLIGRKYDQKKLSYIQMVD